MNNQARTNQGGSVASFIVVGVILTVLVIAGIYFVHQRSQAPAGTTTNTPTTTSSPSGSQSATVPTPSRSAQPTSQPVQPSPQVQSGGTTPNQSETPLPATGPSEDIVAIIGLGMLVGVTAGYIRSRRIRPGTV